MLNNQERTLMKEYEGIKVVLRNEREEDKTEKSEQVIINRNKKGLSNLILSKITGLNIKEI